VTVGELKQLRTFLQAQAGTDGELTGWFDRSPYNYGKPLFLESINLYHVCDWVVKPATARHSCSYVELVATDPAKRKPAWFVSHWWGEAVLDFIACVEKHAEVRGLGEDAVYWVCAYANNQHELGADLGTDPKKSSFYKALQQAEGVLLVLDKQATPFSRIWCCFEESVAVRDPALSLLLDIATVDIGGKAQLLAAGLTREEEAMEEVRKTQPRKASGWLQKSKREVAFPLELVVRHGLKVDIEAAEASVQADKDRILNSVAGNALDQKPAAGHAAYVKVNQALGGIFASEAWRQAVEKKI
jgi:hypothetical protein